LPGDSQWERPFGAVPVERGVEFRVWAPHAGGVHVRIGEHDHELEPEGDGVFARIIADAAPGDDYLFVLGGEEPRPDPCSRWQPGGLRGPSRVLDTSFEIASGPPVDVDDLVLYELHVGTFTEEGTFDAVAPHLPELRDLGVTAIELMPVATFPGNRNWGYDGVYTSAPHHVYGGPHGLARLVDAAHRAGLGVFLDVVYNHIGPGSEAIAAFGPYFTDRHTTFWGDALDYEQRGVREWAIQNAELWVCDYGVDGLRLDAVHAIFDDSNPHICAELAARVRHANPSALVISEMAIGDNRPVAQWGHDAQWDDSLHHSLHAILTGERDGYYERFGDVTAIARAFANSARRVVCAQNHDQVGNRAVGDRLRPDLLRIASSVVLLSPGIPLLFMGEEYGEPNPFQFFTDHIDPQIAEATREGRKREFQAFVGFAGEVPDPQAEETFLRSRLSRQEEPGMRDHYRELLRLRQGIR
jgi:maltooligosyltrehalose trehalohydrolase